MGKLGNGKLDKRHTEKGNSYVTAEKTATGNLGNGKWAIFPLPNLAISQFSVAHYSGWPIVRCPFCSCLFPLPFLPFTVVVTFLLHRCCTVCCFIYCCTFSVVQISGCRFFRGYIDVPFYAVAVCQSAIKRICMYVCMYAYASFVDNFPVAQFSVALFSCLFPLPFLPITAVITVYLSSAISLSYIPNVTAVVSCHLTSFLRLI